MYYLIGNIYPKNKIVSTKSAKTITTKTISISSASWIYTVINNDEFKINKFKNWVMYYLIGNKIPKDKSVSTTSVKQQKQFLYQVIHK